MNARQGREGGGEVSYTEETYDSLFHVHPLSHDRTSICQLPRSLITYTVHSSTSFIPAEVIRGRRGRCLPLRFPRSVQFSSAQLCPTLCDPMNHSTPGLPVHHQLPEFTQTHVHWVGDVIQPSHPLSSPSPPALNPSQHQSLLQWVNSSHEVAKLLEFQL